MACQQVKNDVMGATGIVMRRVRGQVATNLVILSDEVEFLVGFL